MTSHASIPALSTERLLLRPWREEDLPAFAALNADPRVAEFLPKCLERAESDALAERIAAHFRQHGYGVWAVEARGGAPFIGFAGLEAPSFEAHFTPCL
jgi:ribosomal-protein-alanine N-acetyltransferase